MRRQQKIIWNILLWLLVIIPIFSVPIIVFINNESEARKMMPNFDYNLNDIVLSVLAGLINFIIVFYVFYFIIYYLLKRKNINWKRVLIAVSIFIYLIIQKWLTDGLPFNNHSKLTFLERFGNLSITTLIPYCIFTFIQGGFAMGFRTILAYFDEKIKNKKMQVTNLKNEVNMLRSQINPHFLFNSLNNIDSLITRDPERASELLIKLSDEIRYMCMMPTLKISKLRQNWNFLITILLFKKSG